MEKRSLRVFFTIIDWGCNASLHWKGRVVRFGVLDIFFSLFDQSVMQCFFHPLMGRGR